MKGWLSYIGDSTSYGLSWPVWITLAGITLFGLLGLYAGILLLTGKKLPTAIRKLQMPTLKSRLLLGLVLAATLPAISLALVLSERSTHEQLERNATLLQSSADTIASNTGYILNMVSNSIEDLAIQLQGQVNQPTRHLSGWMTSVHGKYASFRSLVVVNRSGEVIAGSSMVNGRLRTFDDPSNSFANRDFFTKPLASGEVYVSNALMDATLDSQPIIIIGAPVTASDGQHWGVVLGYLGLDRLAISAEMAPVDKGAGILITDPYNRVLFASASAGMDALTDLNNSLILRSETMPNRIGAYNFDHQPPGSQSAQKYLAARSTTTDGWQVIVFDPLSQVQNALLEEYAVAFTWLVFTIAISICFALALANSISRPLKALDGAVRHFDLKEDATIPLPPPDAPREVTAVFDHLDSLARRLRRSYGKIQSALREGEKLRTELEFVITNREKEIAKRTEQLKEANSALRRLSRIDSLTGVANRRWFAEFLSQTWRQAQRDKQAISFVIIDIDDFKAYNDTYGHQKGDTCLRAVAEAIRDVVCRGSDMVARYGGEEFVAILGDTPLEGGLRVAENIRKAVEELALPHRESSSGKLVTVSVGVTSTVPSEESEPETYLVAADRALYTAKDEGKNQVAWSTTAETGVFQSLCMPVGGQPQPS